MTSPSFTVSGNHSVAGLAHPPALEASVHSGAESRINHRSRVSLLPILSFHRSHGRAGLPPQHPSRPLAVPHVPASPCRPHPAEPEKLPNLCSSTNTCSRAPRGFTLRSGRRGLSAAALAALAVLAPPLTPRSDGLPLPALQSSERTWFLDKSFSGSLCRQVTNPRLGSPPRT